jgi:hypothetical protein
MKKRLFWGGIGFLYWPGQMGNDERLGSHLLELFLARRTMFHVLFQTLTLEPVQPFG